MDSTTISDKQLFEDKKYYDVCTDNFIPKMNGKWNWWISTAKNLCYNIRTVHITDMQKHKSSRFEDDDSSFDNRNFIYPDDRMEVEEVESNDMTYANLNSFITALPTCYPLFGHLHNLNKSKRYEAFNCFCPCSEQLTPWRKNNNISFIHQGFQCNKEKMDSQRLLSHLQQLKSTCIYHNLAHCYYTCYSSQFKG